jgi:hypothetical protein
MFDIKRVALYEEPGGRLIIHREGSPLAFVLEERAPGGFAADAAHLAEGRPDSEWRPGRGRRVTVRDLKKLPGNRWPDRTGELVAMWEDGQAWLTERSKSAGKESAHEPSWQARRYVGPPR